MSVISGVDSSVVIVFLVWVWGLGVVVCCGVMCYEV